MILSQHPPGLFILFFTEMWERFSYYGMRALLIYYLTRHFLFSDSEAYTLYGSYTAMVYALPVIGGLLADRYLGARKSIILGALLLTFGHFAMIFEGQGGREDYSTLQILHLALALIAVGVGLLKPNISTLVGKLYGLTDSRRDSAFTIFYMGINLGAMTATLLCGYLGETYGWRYGFGAAGIGMLFGLAVFMLGQKHLLDKGEPRHPEKLAAPCLRIPLTGQMLPISLEKLIWIGIAAAVFVVWQMLQYDWLVQGFLLLTAAACVAGLLLFSFLRCAPVERTNMLIMMLLIACSVLFWSLSEQAGTSMSLFTERNLNKTLFGYQIQPSQFQSLNPTFIILLAPLFAWGWQKLAALKLEPSLPAKFGLGIVQVGLGFGALIIGASQADTNGQVALIWMVLAYLLHTTGELCLSPVGLAMVTKLSVARIVGLVMGVWFLSSAFAANLGALIAKASSLEQVDGTKATSMEALAAYSNVFTTLTLIAVTVGAALLIASPWLARHIRLPDETATAHPEKAAPPSLSAP